MIAIICGALLTMGVIAGFILAIINKTDLSGVSNCIGALAGFAGAVIGALLIPAFGGKAAQSFSENQEVQK
jgi:uncharacterized membrane protein YeaQ/YmgE (transglycosylase-associated protein family)